MDAAARLFLGLSGREEAKPENFRTLWYNQDACLVTSRIPVHVSGLPNCSRFLTSSKVSTEIGIGIGNRKYHGHNCRQDRRSKTTEYADRY